MKTLPALVVTAIVITAFAARADALLDGARINLNVDYSMVSMDQVNKQLNKGSSVTTITSGFTGTCGLDFDIAPFLLAGVRAQYLYCMAGRATYLSLTTEISASLIPVEGGLTVNLELPATPISIFAAGFAGYGFAFASLKNDINIMGQTTYTQPFDGGGFVAEIPFGINFKITSSILFHIDGGWRFAKIDKMEQSKDVNYNGIAGISVSAGKKGDILKDSDNNVMAFDYSGFNAGIGFGFGF